MPSIKISEEAGVRYLQFGAHWIQGAMRVNRPWALELEYTRDMMFALLLRRKATWPRRVLLIGLGAASLTKFLYRHCPGAQLDVVEIDPEVILTAWQFFQLPQECRRLRVEIGDGYRYVAATNTRYDLILADGFDAKVRAGNLDSPSFYRNCRAHLKPGGILVTNLVSRRGPPSASIDRIRRVFGESVIVLPANEANTVTLAKAGAALPVSAAFLQRAARNLKTQTGLNLASTVSALVSSAERSDLEF